MRTCTIIYNKVEADSSVDTLDVLDQVAFVEKNLTELGFKVNRLMLTANFMAELKHIAIEKDDIIFNLVEAVGAYDELLHFIPATLDAYGARYTGCSTNGAFLTGNKRLAKDFMAMGGISVPRSYDFEHQSYLQKNKKYIIKPTSEDGSVGITEDSVFLYDGTFRHKPEGQWFIEDYIDGREFNISVLSGEVIPPAEIVFNDYSADMPMIVSYKAKWDEDSFQYKNTVRNLTPVVSDVLMSDMMSVAEKCWKIFDLHGYARVDLRVDSQENVYVMEVNANPCIAEDGGFVAACRNAGFSDSEIVRRIVEDLNNK